MKQIALVIPGLDRIGGAERQVMLLAKGLARRNWRVSVVALSGTGSEAADELSAAGVDFLSLGMRKGLADPRGWLRFHRWLRAEAPEVVHAHLPHAAWLARWSRFAAPVRVLVDTLHSSSTGTVGRRLGYRVSDWLPDVVTAVSRGVAQTHQAAAMVSTDKLRVLSNGVDVEYWKPDATVREAMRREFGIGDKFLWFAAGRLEPVKDYPALLAAMARLPEAATLVIAGEGPLKNDLLQISASLGVGSRVQFLGFEPEVRRWMQAADGFVLTSRWEGLPMSLLEAGGCAVASVTTDVAGSREVIVDGQTGVLATAGNAQAIADAMSRVMQISAVERNGMGTRARERVHQQFSLEAVLDRWEALYDELLQRNPLPQRWGEAA
jgi:glycosyltransferase involved in cell wall biosynthesis